jgi:repressor LexA
MTIGEKIIKRRIELGMSQDELAKKVGYKDRSSIARIESGERDIRQSSVMKFAEALNTTPAWLMDISDSSTPKQKTESNAQLLPSEYIRMIPCFESASAGFGTDAQNRVIDFIPLYIVNAQEAEETICITVRGDSMHPKIEDGDIVQVHKQDIAETGDIVVILDGDEAFVKRFIHGKNGVILESFNPAYPPMKYTREESNNLRIVGVVKRIIRNL